ncbi:MAG TPA: Si-specific NAD(P)(+) transhydrogenase [Candidatus Dormibacteraeota bacterium]|nr:Si-specific NAD(P)(+) transhydrogenase [Candidatus Dormibacteraeota bacterium]
MKGKQYDLVVVGSGPAGEKAAAHAAYFGKSVALVERHHNLGGVVVSNAGIPTKTMREAALYVTGFRKRDIYGLGLQMQPELTLMLLRQRTAEVIGTMAKQVRHNMDRHGIDVIRGTARLIGPNTVSVAAGRATRELEGHAILLATGSRPFHPNDVPFDDPDVHDSETVLDIDHAFPSMLVIGSGAVGSEYASIMASLGIRVTLVEAGPRILAIADGEMSTELARNMALEGIDIHTNTRTESISRERGRLTVALSDGKKLRPGKVLFAVGRTSNSDDLGLEEVGVELGNRGSVLVDERFQTSVPSIFAAGDLIGPPGLASVSVEQGRVAASAACGTSYASSGQFVAPSGVYSIPEVAWVGLTEEQAIERGVRYAVGRSDFRGNSRANIGGMTDGLVKLIFDPKDRRVLGAHAVGEIAAEIIHIAQAVIQFNGDLDYFVHATFNVPTWSDAFKMAAFDGLGKLEASSLVRSATI